MATVPIMAFLGVGGLIWFAVLLRRFGLVGIGLLTLVVGTCFGHAFFNVDIGPLPITADRLCVGLLAVAYVVYRKWGLTCRQKLGKADFAMLAFLGVVCLSTFAHDWRLHGAQPVATLLFFFVLPFVMYWVMRSARLGEHRIRVVLVTFAGLGGYLAATAILEKFQVHALVFPRYIVDASYAEFLGRGRGPLLNPIGNGVLISLGLFSMVMLWHAASRHWRWVMIGATPLYLAGAYCTMTRSVWLGLMAGALLIGLFAVPKRFRIVVAYAAVASVAALVFVGTSAFDSFKRDKHVSVSDMRKSAALRPILAVVAWKMFQDQPHGVGLGQYREQSKYYLQDRNLTMRLETARPYVQHNVFLALLTENGILGCTLFVTLICLWANCAWRLWHANELGDQERRMGVLFLAFLSMYIVNAMFHDLTIIAMMNAFLFFLAGLVRNVAGYSEAEVAMAWHYPWCGWVRRQHEPDS